MEAIKMKMMDKKEDLKYNVDTYNIDFMEHLDSTKDKKPQSEVISATLWLSCCANTPEKKVIETYLISQNTWIVLH